MLVAGRRVGPLVVGENPTQPGGRLTRFGVHYLLKPVRAASQALTTFPHDDV